MRLALGFSHRLQLSHSALERIGSRAAFERVRCRLTESPLHSEGDRPVPAVAAPNVLLVFVAPSSFEFAVHNTLRRRKRCSTSYLFLVLESREPPARPSWQGRLRRAQRHLEGDSSNRQVSSLRNRCAFRSAIKLLGRGGPHEARGRFASCHVSTLIRQ